MAGDWIKVEHATLDKPEITRAAEMLGLSRRETLGLFFDYWVWLDKNLSDSCPGFVRNVSVKSLDRVLQCDGFAATLAAIGWCEFDEKAWTLRVTNAERHNGKTAKTRALDAKRQSEKRRNLSGSKRTESGPEKRREEVLEREAKPPRKRTSKSQAQLPEGWSIPEEWIAWALAERKDWNVAHATSVAARFADHWRSKAEARADWFATWRNWVRGDRALPLQVVGSRGLAL